MAIPAQVLKRLNELVLDPLSLQNPNFTEDVLDYHEPPYPGRPDGPARGSWSHDGAIFEFSLVGQVSGHQTFLDEYGDLFFQKHRSRGTSSTFSQEELERAKVKITLALPHVESEDDGHQTLRRQFENLKAIEGANYNTFRPESAEKKSSFAVRNETQWRASALSDSIFQTYDNWQSDLPPASEHDPLGLVAKLPAAIRLKMQAMPLVFFGSDAEPVERAKVVGLFRPGTWVEVVCTLRVWSTKKGTRHRFGSPSPVTRSYQMRVDAVQRLAEGCIKEGPLRTEPAPRATKRKFTAVD